MPIDVTKLSKALVISILQVSVNHFTTISKPEANFLSSFHILLFQ